MPKINAVEGQTLEFKRQWTDRALEDLAAFANTKGGTLLLGIRDDGEIVGAIADDRNCSGLPTLLQPIWAPRRRSEWSRCKVCR